MNTLGSRLFVSRWWVCGFVLAAGWLLAPNGVQAANDVPYADSFEGYEAGTDIIDGTNWFGPENGLTVRSVSNAYPLRFPMPAATHSNVAQWAFAATNLLNHAGGDTNVWLDCTLLAVRSPVEPTVDGKAQMAMYFNSNGHLCVWHAWYRKPTDDFQKEWTELQHPPIPTDKWVRVTLKLDYLTGDVLKDESGVIHRFYQVYLNGGQPITNALAVKDIPYDMYGRFPENPQDAWQYGGSWFGFADQSWNPEPKKISSVTLRGSGYVDDLVVTNGNVLTFPGVNHTITATATDGGTIYPAGELVVADGQSLTFSGYALPPYYLDDIVVDGVPQGLASTNEFEYTFTPVISNHTIHASFISSAGPSYTTKGVSYAWMDTFPEFDGSNYETEQMLDYDNDGALTWEEYVAGTDPTDSNSVFHVVNVSYEGAQNVVKWYATTNSGVTTPFSMLRSTNLTAVTDAWLMVATNSIPRVSGTNEWTDTNPPAVPAYYRPIVLWPY